jgi:hypothetical protein
LRPFRGDAVKITTLNKVVNLFLVGSLCLLLVGIMSRWELLRWVEGAVGGLGLGTRGDIILTLVGTLVFLALAALVGAIVEALTDVTLIAFVKKHRQSERLARFFLQREVFESNEFWRRKFEEGPQASCWNAEDFKKQGHRIAVGILFKTGSSAAISWAINHYATFILASNFAVLLIALQIFLIKEIISGNLGLGAFTAWQVGAQLAIYALCSLAVDRYIFSYMLAYRHAAIRPLAEGGRTTKGEVGRAAQAS